MACIRAEPLPFAKAGKAREREDEDEERCVLEGMEAVRPHEQDEQDCPSKRGGRGQIGGDGGGDFTFLWRLPLRFLSRLLRNLLIPLMVRLTRVTL